MKALRRRYGRAHAHEIVARRRTYDDVPVQFWSDGAVTVGPERANRYVAKKVPRDLLWIIAGDVALYDVAELPALVKAARKGGDRLGMRKHAPRLTRAADLTEAQREAIRAGQKRTVWFDPQTGVLTYAPGFLPSERRRRR